MKIFTKEDIDEIIEKYKYGYLVSRSDKIWHQNLIGVRNSGIKYYMSPTELEEYIKCKFSIEYFAEEYCKIKLEKGDIGKMLLNL